MANETIQRYAKGSAVSWHVRNYIVEGDWSPSHALLRDPATQKFHDAPWNELKPGTVGPVPTSPSLAGIPESEWQIVVERHQAIASLLANGRADARAIAATAEKLKVSNSTVRRLIKQYKRSDLAMAFVRQRPGPRPGTRRLPDAVEALITRQIHGRWLTQEAPRASVFIEEVQRKCRTEGLPVPKPGTIRKRLKNLPGRTVLLRRRGRKAAEALTPHVVSHKATRPLEEVQIDHTLVDLICVTDDEDRLPIARPYLTLAICIKTRAIAGYYLSLDKPDAFAVGLCIATAAMQKADLLASLGIQDATWLMQGLIKKAHLDNAKEHHALALRRGCEANGIILEYRMPGRPYFGGHVERLMGTMMRKLHALPGSTRSNIVERGEYDPERHAVMTFPDLHRYLVMQICAYNLTVHSELGMSPNQAWLQAFTGSEGYRPPVAPPRSLQFLVDFMPCEYRMVRRDGIELFGIRYWDNSLIPLIGFRERVAVHYDSRDMSRVYTLDPGGALLTASYADPTLPRRSRNEWAFVRKRARALGRRPDEIVQRDDILNAADAQVSASRQLGRKASRRRLERRKQGLVGVNRTYSLFDPPVSPQEPPSDANLALPKPPPIYTTFAME